MVSIRKKRPASVRRVEIELGKNAREFLEGLVRPPIGETSIGQKLDALIDMQRAQAHVPAELALAKEELSIVHELINNLNGKVETMSTHIERIEKEASDLAENVTQVRDAIDGLKASQNELKTLVADLQAQLAQNQLDQERLAAAASKLEKVDEDLDAITLPGTSPEPTGEVTTS